VLDRDVRRWGASAIGMTLAPNLASVVADPRRAVLETDEIGHDSGPSACEFAGDAQFDGRAIFGFVRHDTLLLAAATIRSIMKSNGAH
jgi:hypothetical protein